jgi:F-type H+-transporting ATPase subunit gamma
MASIIALKRRIQVAQNVSKTTRAMQMIAASKLKRAQDAALLSRPYVEKLTEMTLNTASRVEKENLHDYMKEKNGDKNLILVISPDKGLAGSLVSNLTREMINTKTKDTVFITVGRKADLASAKLGNEIIGSFPFGTTLPSFGLVYPILQLIDENFLKGKVSKVQILTTKFISIFTQKPALVDLLPVKLNMENKSESQMLFEPNLEELLPNLLRHYVEMTVYQNILESYASEQAARMIAMKNATDNAKELVQELRLEYNKGRQEKITNEILDISSATFAFAV